MAELLLGISVGFFMYAFVNSKWNRQKWIESKYPFWTGVLLLGVSLLLFFLRS